MARKNRIWYPGAIYHVMNRGNRKESIFRDNEDYLLFLQKVKEVKSIYPCKIHALCLMPNHFHLELETEDVEPGKIMSKLLSTYATSFNKKYSLSGHLFGGRYKACLIKDDAYFLEVSRYIHLNPVKALMVKSPLDYKYSSYPLFVANGEKQRQSQIDKCLKAIVDTSGILSLFGNDKEHYRMFVKGEHLHTEQELLLMKDMNENEMWLPKE